MERLSQIKGYLGLTIEKLEWEISSRIKWLKEEPDGTIQWGERQTEWLAIKSLQTAMKQARDAYEIVNV
jgi:hypothetical protein